MTGNNVIELVKHYAKKLHEGQVRKIGQVRSGIRKLIDDLS